MQNSQLFSRRNAEEKVDFRLNTEPESPSSQLRRLRRYLDQDTPIDAQDIMGCDDALAELREFSYRKIFTGTSHAEFLELDASDPQHIDWQIAIHELESQRFRGQKPRS